MRHDQPTAPRIARGLDSIRFLCALCVVIGHMHQPPITDSLKTFGILGLFIHGFYRNAFSGPAAVIVFFVISGFCIHYPFAGTKRIPHVAAYFARRYIRITVPMFVAIVLAQKVFEVDLTLFQFSILWSLLAELVYYTLYSTLLWLRRSFFSWEVMVCVAFVMAFAVVATDPLARSYPSYGSALNWILGLPCWLMGCRLAERVREGGYTSAMEGRALWLLRTLIWGLAVLCSVARFHSPIGYPWTLNIFSIAVAFWLAKEIVHFHDRQPTLLMEWAGRWSYSLYISHLLAFAVLEMVIAGGIAAHAITWPLELTFVLVFGFVFALLFEFPAHALARRFSRFLSEQPALNIALPLPRRRRALF